MRLAAADLPGPRLTPEQAGRLARLPLACLGQEFPNKPGETLAAPADIGSPRGLHPAFYGCFDWHSSVHGHWMLVRLLQTFPGLPESAAIRAVLAATPHGREHPGRSGYYLSQPNRKSFERTYGWAWLLKLAEELHDLGRTAGARAGKEPAAAHRPGRAALPGVPAQARSTPCAWASTPTPLSAWLSPGITRRLSATAN